MAVCCPNTGPPPAPAGLPLRHAAAAGAGAGAACHCGRLPRAPGPAAGLPGGAAAGGQEGCWRRAAPHCAHSASPACLPACQPTCLPARAQLPCRRPGLVATCRTPPQRQPRPTLQVLGEHPAPALATVQQADAAAARASAAKLPIRGQRNILVGRQMGAAPPPCAAGGAAPPQPPCPLLASSVGRPALPALPPTCPGTHMLCNLTLALALALALNPTPPNPTPHRSPARCPT
jgi:hypothetical protein